MSAYQGVNHNYERENRYNLWFVVTGASAPEVQWTLSCIEYAAGVPVLRLPLLEEYHIDLGFDLGTGVAPRRVALVHVLRNALIPVVAVLGPVLAVLVTGSIVIERVFEIPGMGSLYLLAIISRDYGVIMSMTLIYTIAIAGMNLVVDLLYGVIDPRIREAQVAA